MAKYNELVYMCLDLLREKSDDAYYTEEHVIFWLNKMRALLLERKIKGSRNAAYQTLSEQDKQTICLDLVPTELLPYGCSGNWLMSEQEIPSLVGDSLPYVYTVNDVLSTTMSYIPVERMPYVGHNKWLKNITYVTRSTNGHLYLQSNNPQFIFLEQIKLDGVFEDPSAAAELSCNADGSVGCDILTIDFPLEDALIPHCIEMVVQELAGPRYAYDDSRNNARDDVSQAGVVSTKPQTPANDSEDYRRTAQRKKKEDEEDSK